MAYLSTFFNTGSPLLIHNLTDGTLANGGAVAATREFARTSEVAIVVRPPFSSRMII